MTDKPKCPFKDAIVGDEIETVQNPFSGAECALEPDAVATYDVIKGAEQIASMGMLSEERTQQMWETVREGTAWFRQHYPEEYMILLD